MFGDVNGAITIDALQGGEDGYVHVAGDLNEDLTVTWTGAPFNGLIEIDEDVNALIDLNHDADGVVHVHGDLNGDGAIHVHEDLNGKVLIDGSLLDTVADPEIDIDGSVGAGGAVAVDYDGWQTGDEWEDGATITVGDTTFTGNTPAARIYEITSWRGDMNNDELLNFSDVDPFVLALLGLEQYMAEYPGLGGSMEYHGDANCDGYFNFSDVDPFVALVVQECCDPDCSGCRGGESLSPEELASELAAHVAPERYDTLVEIVAEVALIQKDAQRQAYWEAVYSALVE